MKAQSCGACRRDSGAPPPEGGLTVTKLYACCLAPLRQKPLAVALCALPAPQPANEPPSPLLAPTAPISRRCAPPCQNPALPPLEFALQRRNRSNRILQCRDVLVVVVPRHRRRFVADD